MSTLMGFYFAETYNRPQPKN